MSIYCYYYLLYRPLVCICVFVCVYVCVCVCLIYILYYFPLQGVGLVLYALDAKLTKLTLKFGCRSYHVTSQRKSAHINKLSAQIPKAFHQHGIAERQDDLVIDALGMKYFKIFRGTVFQSILCSSAYNFAMTVYRSIQCETETSMICIVKFTLVSWN